MMREYRNEIEVLIPMFDIFDETLFKGRPLDSYRYVVMGQVCVEKDYRGRGVFRQLYEAMCRHMRPHFDVIATEIDVRNVRSINAHKYVGFEVIRRYTSHDKSWVVVAREL